MSQPSGTLVGPAASDLDTDGADPCQELGCVRKVHGIQNDVVAWLEGRAVNNGWIVLGEESFELATSSHMSSYTLVLKNAEGPDTPDGDEAHELVVMYEYIALGGAALMLTLGCIGVYSSPLVCMRSCTWSHKPNTQPSKPFHTRRKYHTNKMSEG